MKRFGLTFYQREHKNASAFPARGNNSTSHIMTIKRAQQTSI